MRVLVFGDSIAYGAWDEQGGWVDRIKRTAHTKTIKSKGTNKLQIINLGIGSDTSTKILNRIKSETESRYSASWPFIIIISFGTNDCRKNNGKIETPIKQFESNVKNIISIAKQYSNKILFVEAPPIAEPTVMFKGQEYSDDLIVKYNDCTKVIVQDANLQFVQVHPIFKETGLDKLYCYDKLHPNNKGHQLIANIVQPYLDTL